MYVIVIGVLPSVPLWYSSFHISSSQFPFNLLLTSFSSPKIKSFFQISLMLMAASSFFLFSSSHPVASSSLSLSHKPLHSTFLLSSSTNPSPLLLTTLPFNRFKKPNSELRTLTIAKSNNNSDSADASDRLISALCYFYPFFDGIQYGKYVITQFYPLQAIIQPLVPAIRVFKSFPFNGFLVFLTLYFVVVRNPNFSRYVRFNTMQAIVLDVLLIFPDLLERSFNPRDGLGLDFVMSLDSTVFLFLLVSLIYGSSSCLLGQIPRLPIVADAADRQSLRLKNTLALKSGREQDEGSVCFRGEDPRLLESSILELWENARLQWANAVPNGHEVCPGAFKGRKRRLPLSSNKGESYTSRENAEQWQSWKNKESIIFFAEEIEIPY
ncbi:hypothetical protein RIF29_18117 [Crotalaria pallida]|uniref:Protein TIC 20 n=1 Tax=Crotalaria pallida TaxID=3830 RepID=A0AAN9IDL8_CROPI